MAAPAPRKARTYALPRQTSPLERAVVTERAKRRAKIEHEAEKRRAAKRFYVLILALLFVTAILALTIWYQIQALFGL